MTEGTHTTLTQKELYHVIPRHIAGKKASVTQAINVLIAAEQSSEEKNTRVTGAAL